MEWTAELEKLKAEKASYQSASAKQAVLEKIHQTTGTHFKKAAALFTGKLLQCSMKLQ